VNGNVIAALIVFRIVYFFVPLMLGGVLLSGAELVRWRAGGNGDASSESGLSRRS
jgi:uncharacterized membrane protein YbhN (UPF0104 family)